MNPSALKILRKVSETGELSLHDALHLGEGSVGDHREQYPLALLIEEEYVGCTLRHTPPPGAELMREYTQAVAFYMFTMPKDSDGCTRYLGIVSSGSVDPKDQRIFLKAKGALYLDAAAAKRRERYYNFVIAVSVGAITGVFLAWLRKYL
jgi:hypothetical protein